MSTLRKVLYSSVVVCLVFILIEGTARIIWARMEGRVFRGRIAHGEQALLNSGLNFFSMPHRIYGYTLRPGSHHESIQINGQGFHQRDEIPVQRRPGFLRVICLGESTTFGVSADISYPSYLRGALAACGRGFQGYEVINAGVPGWVSDQIALRSQHELASFHPDAVILYVGWNDFQSYDPLSHLAATSYFEQAFGETKWKQYATHWLRSVALLSAWYHSRPPEGHPALHAPAPGSEIPPEKLYAFTRASLDQTVTAFRGANPAVKIFVCTLVGRWPQGADQDWHDIPLPWWVAEHHLSRPEAGRFVHQFNDDLRRFARRRGLFVIDAEREFENLNRLDLLRDWLHMYSEGYELLAWTMFSSLRDAGVVGGEPAPRYAELIAKYHLPSRGPDHVSPAAVTTPPGGSEAP